MEPDDHIAQLAASKFHPGKVRLFPNVVFGRCNCRRHPAKQVLQDHDLDIGRVLIGYRLLQFHAVEIKDEWSRDVRDR